ncbi:auxin-binding protein [Thalassotalea euphylliae]|uniref:Auxin-binding protein n=1 Tax=Thalassotalea euphylliae TaxID=1655234 RepID=A0A3E0TPV8_9GAMM|nr:FixH family protein [Thalassotalea euphylliae]REL26360.1 auxin-binding protein [Thalassotalea euphylliae]
MSCTGQNASQQRKADKQAFHYQITSEQGLFLLSLTTEQNNKPPIGYFHNHIITLTDSNKSPVYPALINISGGMPEHGHGLPSQPQITRYLGNGQYLLEGVKFNMSGNWRITFRIRTNELTDSATLNFSLSH